MHRRTPDSASAHLLNKQVSLDTGVTDVLGVLNTEELSDVVLVGHSFGVIPLLGVADRVLPVAPTAALHRSFDQHPRRRPSVKQV